MLLACEESAPAAEHGDRSPATGQVSALEKGAAAPPSKKANEPPAGPAQLGRSTRESTPKGPPAPERGCRLLSTATLGQNLGAARIAVRQDGIWVAAYGRSQGARSLARFHLMRAGDVRTLPPLPLGEAGDSLPKVPPALVAGRRLWIAAIDAKANLRLWGKGDDEAPAPVTIASQVDRRFPPALRELSAGRALVAYTEGDATGMRVHAAVVGDDEVRHHAVTPRSHGATAPRFVVGSASAELLMIDARSGMSPLLRVPFDESGSPGEATVARPVNLPYSPPALVGVRLGEAKTHVAYTAIGSGATAAVGLVPLEGTAPPLALLRGSGYALLSVDAASGPERAVFAMDAPRNEKPDPPLEVHVRVWDGERLGAPLVLAGEGSRMRPAVAYDARTDQVVLASVREGTLQVHRMRCDLGDAPAP